MGFMRIIAGNSIPETSTDDIATFKKETLDLCFDRIKISCFVAIPVFFLFLIIDSIQEPANFRFFLLLRICESALLLSILGHIYKSQRTIHPFVLGALIFSSLGFVLSLMIRYAASFPQLYTQALSLILIGMGLGMPWRVKEAFYTALSILLFYVAFNFSKEGPDQVIFVNNLFFLSTVIAITLATTYVNYRLRFRESLSRYNLNRVNNDLKNAKNKLEDSNTQLEKALRELQEMQGQLVQSEKMAALGLLVAGMAHEVNNPLNFINASLSILRRALERRDSLVLDGKRPDDQDIQESNGKIQNALSTVRRGLERIEKIVADLLAYSRQDELQFHEVDLHEGIDATLMLLKPMWEGKIHIVREFGEIRRVDAIPGQLNQVFLNLLKNAIEAVPEGRPGEIRIETGQEGDQVWVRIKDNGEGISAKNLNRIFEPFFTTKEVGKGTGLGLWSSSRIVQTHGGEIRMQSHPGEWAEVTLLLPLQHHLSARN